MSRRVSLRTTLMLSLLALACERTPTEPNSTWHQPADASSVALPSNSWTARARVPTAREQHSAGMVNNSAGQPVLYVFGGVDPVEGFDISTVEAYNYVTNSWTTKAAPLLRARTNGVGLIGGKLYVSGGISDTGDGHEATRTMFAYDPITDVFTRKADMPRPTSDGVTGVIGGKLYVLTGGCGNCAVFVSRRFWRYDPATNAWSFLPQCPRAHLSGAGGVINGKLYVAGGSNEAFSATKNLDVYDPVTNKWTARAPLPETVFAAAGAVLNNKLYVIGGTVGADSHTSNTVFAYDPATNTWTTKAPMLTARFRLAAAGLVTPFGNPKILAVGGLDLENPSAGGANELYTP